MGMKIKNIRNHHQVFLIRIFLNCEYVVGFLFMRGKPLTLQRPVRRPEKYKKSERDPPVDMLLWRFPPLYTPTKSYKIPKAHQKMVSFMELNIPSVLEVMKDTPIIKLRIWPDA